MNMTHNDFIILKKVFKIENHFFKKLNSIITNNPNNIKKTKEKKVVIIVSKCVCSKGLWCDSCYGEYDLFD